MCEGFVQRGPHCVPLGLHFLSFDCGLVLFFSTSVLMPFNNTKRANFLCIFPSVLLLTPLCCKRPPHCSVFSFRGFRVLCSVYKAFGSRQNGWHGSVPPIYCLSVSFSTDSLFLSILFLLSSLHSLHGAPGGAIQCHRLHQAGRSSSLSSHPRCGQTNLKHFMNRFPETVEIVVY